MRSELVSICRPEMGAVISDLLREDKNLELKERVKRFLEESDTDDLSTPNDPRYKLQSEQICDSLAVEELEVLWYLRAWPKLAELRRMDQIKPLTFGQKFEKLFLVDDVSMVERSSTPVVELEFEDEAEENQEYCAWIEYLNTPGTFKGQLVPNIPGAFSGQMFPQSDPRWIFKSEAKELKL